MRGILDKFYQGIPVVIPVPRARQPREEEMKCGSQSADVRMIHRRSHLLRVAFPIRCHAPHFQSRLNCSCLREKTPCLRLTSQDMSKFIPQLHGHLPTEDGPDHLEIVGYAAARADGNARITLGQADLVGEIRPL